MLRYHQETRHSYASVRQYAHTLDWTMQPSVYKRYPERFRRFPLSSESSVGAFLRRIGGITAQKRYPSGTYALRANPSAGALYPNEIYVQLRNVEGWQNGIYHYEVVSDALVLLHTLEGDEGIEPYVGYRTPMRGFLFLVSMLYWRSSWKYRDRAYRYCLLDAGHILGNIEASAYLLPHAVTMRYNINAEALHRCFGFDRQERFVAAANVAVPIAQNEAKAVAMKLPCVDATGTFMPNLLIERAYEETRMLLGCRKGVRAPRFHYRHERWAEAMLSRRSQRGFAKAPVSRGQFAMLQEALEAPVLSDCDEPIEVYAVVHRVSDMPPGIYRNGELMKEGIFTQEAGYLCLEQHHLCGEGAVCFFFVSRGLNYRALYQKAGILAQRLYVVATYAGMGASGIGAYYDDETAEFLGLDAETMVLYAFAIGK